MLARPFSIAPRHPGLEPGSKGGLAEAARRVIRESAKGPVVVYLREGLHTWHRKIERTVRELTDENPRRNDMPLG
jgi:hypothetical protein